MGLRRSGGDAELLAYFLVRAARGDECDDLALPGGDREGPLDQDIHHDVESTAATVS